jgi:hypothetical protein
VTAEPNLSQQVLRAVEDLTEQGSVGFYASAIVALTQLNVEDVTKLLLKMVGDQILEPQFELRCPDNGRRIKSYKDASEIPFGKEMSSSRCESDEPFIIDQTDVYIRFRPSPSYTADLLRRKHERGGGQSGKARQIRLHWGISPHLALRPTNLLTQR